MSSASGCCRAKQRQHRTHKKFYDAYLAGMNYEVNKARKLMRHLKRFPRHKQPLDCLLKLPPVALKKAGLTDRGKYVASLEAVA